MILSLSFTVKQNKASKEADRGPSKKQEGKERREEWSRREGVWRLKSHSSFWLLQKTNLNRSPQIKQKTFLIRNQTQNLFKNTKNHFYFYIIKKLSKSLVLLKKIINK
jgi:hypothetical protein